MNLQEIDKWLDEEFGVSYTRLEELHDFVLEQGMKKEENLQKQLEAYENMRKEAINKLKEHKKDLDYEPWSLYEVRGSILFDLSNILNKVGGSDE